MSKENGSARKGKALLALAKRELYNAKRSGNKLKAEQISEKGYSALLKFVNAYLEGKGIPREKLPKSERGRSYLLRKYASRDLRNLYDALYKRLHIDGFHEGIINFQQLEEDLNEVKKLLAQA